MGADPSRYDENGKFITPKEWEDLEDIYYNFYNLSTGKYVDKETAGIFAVGLIERLEVSEEEREEIFLKFEEEWTDDEVLKFIESQGYKAQKVIINMF